jgi:hypothetical protein
MKIVCDTKIHYVVSFWCKVTRGRPERGQPAAFIRGRGGRGGRRIDRVIVEDGGDGDSDEGLSIATANASGQGSQASA